MSSSRSATKSTLPHSRVLHLPGYQIDLPDQLTARQRAPTSTLWCRQVGRHTPAAGWWRARARLAIADVFEAGCCTCAASGSTTSTSTATPTS